MQSNPAKVRTAIRRIVMCAAMTAMSIVLCRFLGISPANSAFRIEIGFLPIAVVAMLYDFHCVNILSKLFNDIHV